jgi:hypothetical protein
VDTQHIRSALLGPARSSPKPHSSHVTRVKLTSDRHLAICRYPCPAFSSSLLISTLVYITKLLSIFLIDAMDLDRELGNLRLITKRLEQSFAIVQSRTGGLSNSNIKNLALQVTNIVLGLGTVDTKAGSRNVDTMPPVDAIDAATFLKLFDVLPRIVMRADFFSEDYVRHLSDRTPGKLDDTTDLSARAIYILSSMPFTGYNRTANVSSAMLGKRNSNPLFTHTQGLCASRFGTD